MTNFEFYSRLNEWHGDNHFRAWSERMKSVAPGFIVREGTTVCYAFQADDFDSAKALSELIFSETRIALHQKGPREISFRKLGD